MSEFVEVEDEAIFEDVIETLEAEVAAVGVHLQIDQAARQRYSRLIRAMSEELQMDVRNGVLTWKQAAEQANEARNMIMETLRGRSTPIGRAIAERMKKEGKTLNEIIAKKTLEMAKKGEIKSSTFSSLSKVEQGKVYAKVVESAGKSNPRLNASMARLRYAGRALIVLSVAISVYTIATAEDKTDAAAKELAITGAGIGGGFAGGALAGLACGPGAPVCVTIGAFVGGALAAFGVSMTW